MKSMTDKRKALSVIIPAYNTQQHIEKCVESVLAQKRKDLEIILINDGSTDHTEHICKNLKQTYGEQILFLTKQNEGVSAARNLGIEKANSSYVMFLDSDDFLEPNICSKMLENAETFDLVICGYAQCEKDTEKIMSSFSCPSFSGKREDFLVHTASYLNPPFLLGPCFKLFNLDLIKKNQILFPPELSYGEDAVFVFHYLEICRSIRCIPDIGYYYRKNQKSSLSAGWKKEKLQINYRIAKQIETLLIQNHIANYQDISDGWFLNCITSYMQETAVYENSFQEVKGVFRNVKNIYQVNRLLADMKCRTKAQHILRIAARGKIWENILYLFRLKSYIQRKNL